MSQTQTPPAVKPSKVDPSPGHEPEHHGDEQGIPKDLEAPSGFAIAIAVGAFVLLLIALFIVGYIPSHREETQTRDEAVARSKMLPVVQWINPVTTSGTHDVILPCNVKANQATALYTRTNGYLRKWYFDIGQHVEAGQLMADIETPEVDAQLKQSQASLQQNEAAVKKAEADKDLAQTTLNRYLISQKETPGSVTEEAIDQNKSALKDADAALVQANANVAAAKANVQQLQTQVGFEKVYAPFSGTVTARNYDVGALLSPTNTSPGSEIFDLAQTDLLRVFVNVPQEYSNDVKLNEKAKLYIRNFPGKSFDGVIYATTGAVDPNTRTLSVQINFPNKDGQLFAGEYGEIHLPVTDPQTVGLIPTSALIFNAKVSGLQVATVTDDSKVKMKRIITGRDFGTTIEVTKGLDEDDKVITNPSERVAEGVTVDAKEAPKPAPTPAASKPTTTP
jgi:membrane fusion protein (multidrug efflux system)